MPWVALEVWSSENSYSVTLGNPQMLLKSESVFLIFSHPTLLPISRTGLGR